MDAWLGFWTVTLASPFSEGFAQIIDGWYDRDVDAINKPYCLIPSGAITLRQVLEQLDFDVASDVGSQLLHVQRTTTQSQTKLDGCISCWIMSHKFHMVVWISCV